MHRPDGGGGRLKLLVFVEHDIIVRHFLHANAFSELCRHHDVSFVFPNEGHRRLTLDVAALDLGGPVRRLAPNGRRLQLWKWLFLADILRPRRGAHFAAQRRFRRAIIGWKAALWLNAMALPFVFPLFKKWIARELARTPNSELHALLDREAPDILLHPTVLDGVYIDDLIDAATERSIPLITLMNSWDNPSTKRTSAATPDWLLVWGPQTHEHAVEFMGMPPDRTVIFGAAQFDVYRHPPRIDREEFCRQHRVDPNARMILYAGSSKGTDEFAHLRLLDDAIENGELGNTVVVYRPHPWGGAGSGGERIIDHPWKNVRLERSMLSYLSAVKAGTAGISTPDYRDTHDLLCSVDAVISPLSTILVEASLHGKPSMCFLPDDDASHYRYSLPMVHFQDFFSDPRYLIIKGNDALVDGARELLARVDAPNTAQQCIEAAKRFVTSFDEPYSARLLHFVEARASRSDEARSASALKDHAA